MDKLHKLQLVLHLYLLNEKADFMKIANSCYSGFQLGAIQNLTLGVPDTPLLNKATVYTQVIESLPVLELPHPNPPRMYWGGNKNLLFPPFIRGD
jgi:hypothetical protein